MTVESDQQRRQERKAADRKRKAAMREVREQQAKGRNKRG